MCLAVQPYIQVWDDMCSTPWIARIDITREHSHFHKIVGVKCVWELLLVYFQIAIHFTMCHSHSVCPLFFLANKFFFPGTCQHNVDYYERWTHTKAMCAFLFSYATHKRILSIFSYFIAPVTSMLFFGCSTTLNTHIRHWVDNDDFTINMEFEYFHAD